MTSQTLERQRSATENQRRPNILIVDDDHASADVLSLRLDRLGFDTTTADCGELALTLARSDSPDVILLDLRLPDSDGLDICQQLVDDPATSDIPVIIVSGMERPDIVRRSRAAGCQFFVRKPYDPNALLILIQQAMEEVA